MRNYGQYYFMLKVLFGKSSEQLGFSTLFCMLEKFRCVEHVQVRLTDGLNLEKSQAMNLSVKVCIIFKLRVIRTACQVELT